MEMWLVLCGSLALLLRVGFAWQASGSVRAKNAAGSVLRLVADTACSAIAFWAIGAAILLNLDNRVFSIDAHMLFGQSSSFIDTTFFHLVIFLSGGAIVAGALAERGKFYVGVIASVVLAALVIPLAGHWVWFGWLKELGFIDVGGASVIHLSAAVCAAIGALLVGPRMGKYNKDGSSNSVPGHALPLSSIGTLMLLVAWFPYLIGCVVAHDSSGDLSTVGFGVVGLTATNIILAAAGGALAGMMYGQFRYGKPDVFFTYIGLMGGLVAITAGAASMGNFGALITGAIAGVIVPLLTFEIDMRWHLDDPLGVVAIHGFGGLWGTLAAALFTTGTVGERIKMLGIQAMGAAVILLLAAVVSIGVFTAIKATLGLRVNDTDEFDGLDLGEHDINAYPDFQQTTIKSYHLREA